MLFCILFNLGTFRDSGSSVTSWTFCGALIGSNLRSTTNSKERDAIYIFSSENYSLLEGMKQVAIVLSYMLITAH